MTMDLTLDPPRQAGRGRTAAVTNQGASYLVASSQVAGADAQEVRPHARR